MRREGLKASNRTLRWAKCGANSSTTCTNHCYEAIEFAYQSLLITTSKTRFSRKDLYEAALKETGAQGAYLNKDFQCNSGKCFRKGNRKCSCIRCNPYAWRNVHEEKKRDIRADIIDQLHTYP